MVQKIGVWLLKTNAPLHSQGSLVHGVVCWAIDNIDAVHSNTQLERDHHGNLEINYSRFVTLDSCACMEWSVVLECFALSSHSLLFFQCAQCVEYKILL